MATGGNMLVAGTSILSGDVTTNNDITINNTAAILQLKSNSDKIGYFQLDDNDVRLGTNSGNTTGNVIVRMDGDDRIKFEKSGRMTLLADINPTITFASGGVTQSFMQVLGNNLNISATSDKVIINDDLIVDDATGRVGIGTMAPEQKLHVQGIVKVNTGKVLNNSNENLLPYGYAVFNASGTKASGTASIILQASGVVITLFLMRVTEMIFPMLPSALLAETPVSCLRMSLAMAA